MSKSSKIKAQPTFKWVKCTDPFEVFNTTTNIGGVDWLISQPYRIDKGGLKIFYTKIGERFYGGYRYIDDESEMILDDKIITRFYEGTIKKIDRTSEFMRYASMGYPVMAANLKMSHDFVKNN